MVNRPVQVKHCQNPGQQKERAEWRSQRAPAKVVTRGRTHEDRMGQQAGAAESKTEQAHDWPWPQKVPNFQGKGYRIARQETDDRDPLDEGWHSEIIIMDSRRQITF